MWKIVTRGIRESLERRTCRTNVYSQTSQDSNSNSSEQKKTVSCDKNFLAPCFSAFYHGYCGNAKQCGTKDEENHNKYDAKYTWTDAVGWSSILAVGYVVCQSLCIRRKLFEIDNKKVENWRNNLLIKSQFQASRLLNHLFLLPQPNYILPVSKKPIQPQDSFEILIDTASSVDQCQEYGPLTAEETFNEAVNEFSQTHETIMGKLELDFGSKAIEDKRYEDAIEHFTAGANYSSAGSMFNLGLCHELGLGTALDYSKAAKYYKQAAAKGHTDAMYNLGIYHAQGKGGLKVNLVAARQLFKEAAKKGHVQALEALRLEKSYKKYRNLEHNTKYNLEAKTMNSTRGSNFVSKLVHYNILKDLSDPKFETDHFINSFDDHSKPKNATELFLDMLGVTEQSAIPLLTVAESG